MHRSNMIVKITTTVADLEAQTRSPRKKDRSRTYATEVITQEKMWSPNRQPPSTNALGFENNPLVFKGGGPRHGIVS